MFAYIIITITATICIFFAVYAFNIIKNSHNNALYNILDQTRTYGILIDNSNKITRISNSMCELLEVEHFELIGKPLTKIFKDTDRAQINAALSNIHKNKLEIIDSISIKTKTRQAHLLCKFAKVEGLLNFHSKLLLCQDRTDIVNNLKKLEKSEKTLKEYVSLFQSSFEDSFLPAIIISEDCKITNFNKSFHSLVKKEKIITNKDLICDLLGLECATFKSKVEKNKCFEISCKINNRSKDFVFNTHKIKQSDGKIFILCQIQDITKQKQSEQIRKVLENKIIQTRKVEYLGELSGMISHEFNNALMPILSFSKSVEKSLPDEFVDEKDKLQKVIEASNHAKKMISQIMEIKHIDYHDTEEVDLIKLLRANLDSIQFPENINLDIHCETNSAMTSANFDVLSTAFNNVIKNSCQAMANKGGQIYISIVEKTFDKSSGMPKSLNQANIEKGKPYYAFEIKDTGEGINNKDIESIFNPFFTTKQFNKQIGTGLTYVYNCMERFNIPLCIQANQLGGVSLTAFFPKI